MNKKTTCLTTLLFALLLWAAVGRAQSDNTSVFSHLTDSTRVSQVSLIGSHNSATFGVRGIHRRVSKCVRHTFEEQFAMGVRYFDIRLNLVDGKMAAFHGIADCYIDWQTIQAIFSNLLKEHPDEIIFVRILRADDTFKTDVTNEEWETALKEQSNNLYTECYNDTEIGHLRGRVVCINTRFMRYFAYVDNEDYNLKATAKDIEKKLKNISKQLTHKVPAGHINMVTFNSRGHIPVLSVIPDPEKFADKLSKAFHLPEGDTPIWCNFDFPEKFAHTFSDILSRNEKYRER